MRRGASVGANAGERSAGVDHVGGDGGLRLLRWRHLGELRQKRDEQGARGCRARGDALSDASLAISDEWQARWSGTVVGCVRGTHRPPSISSFFARKKKLEVKGQERKRSKITRPRRHLTHAVPALNKCAWFAYSDSRISNEKLKTAAAGLDKEPSHDLGGD